MRKILLVLEFAIFLFLGKLSSQTIYYWDTLDFETPYPHLFIDTLSGNTWQIGEPQKVIFNSAFSGSNAIVTDTILNYPINNTSEFILAFGEFNFPSMYPMVLFFEIVHKYDTDTLKDGGFISISFDMGTTWTNIIEDFGSSAVTPASPGLGSGNLYDTNDTLFNGEYGFSGRSNDWDTCWFAWYYQLVKDQFNFNDTTLLKFSFISDDNDTGKEGWMIDHIVLYSDMGMIGDIDNTNTPSVSIFPNPASEFIEVNINESGRNWVASIYDLSGKKLFAHEYSNQKSRIDLGDFKNGAYILETKFTESKKPNKQILIINK